MRGALHVWVLSNHAKDQVAHSLLIGFLPTAFRAREIRLQYSRKPARCQRTTVSGVTRINDFFQPEQTCRKTTQNIRSTELSRGRGRFACRATVVAEGRGSPGGVLLGSERRRRPSRADVEGAQTSGNHSEKRAGQMLLQVIDSAIVQSFGELRPWPLSPFGAAPRTRRHRPSPAATGFFGATQMSRLGAYSRLSRLNPQRQRAFRVRSTLESIQSDSRFPGSNKEWLAASKCRRDVSLLLEIGLRLRILLNGLPSAPASG